RESGRGRSPDRTRAAPTPSFHSRRSAASTACRGSAARRTRAGDCGRRSRVGTDRSRGSRSRLSLLAEATQQPPQLLRLEALAGLSGIVEEPAARLGPELLALHLLLDQTRRLVACLAGDPRHELARAIEDVHAAPVDELEDADAGIPEPESSADGAVDLLRRRHALLDEANRLVHQNDLKPRDDEARRIRAVHRSLAQALEERDR